MTGLLHATAIISTTHIMTFLGTLASLFSRFKHAALTDSLFWLGLGIILPAGYAVAYPAMYWAMKREQKRGRKDSNPPPSLIKIREIEIVTASINRQS